MEILNNPEFKFIETFHIAASGSCWWLAHGAKGPAWPPQVRTLVTAVFPCTVHGNEEKRLPGLKKIETFHIDMIEHAGHFTVEVITSLVSVSLCTMTHEI
jgi:hypothetical protein